jgi:hypothetical protein
MAGIGERNPLDNHSSSKNESYTTGDVVHLFNANYRLFERVFIGSCSFMFNDDAFGL